MKKGIYKSFKSTVNHWYIPGIVGLIFIAIGIYTFTSPLNLYVALTLLFSISFVVTGISEIIFSLTNKDEMDSWGWVLAFGIISLVIGVLLLIHPAISMVTLPYFVGFLVLFRSISAISFSLDLKGQDVSNWGALMGLGIVGLILSFIMIWNPAFAGMTIVVWTGLALLVSGIFSVYLSFKLKKLNDRPDSIPEELRTRLKQLELEVEAANRDAHTPTQ